MIELQHDVSVTVVGIGDVVDAAVAWREQQCWGRGADLHWDAEVRGDSVRTDAGELQQVRGVRGAGTKGKRRQLRRGGQGSELLIDGVPEGHAGVSAAA